METHEDNIFVPGLTRSPLKLLVEFEFEAVARYIEVEEDSVLLLVVQVVEDLLLSAELHDLARPIYFVAFLLFPGGKSITQLHANK